LSDTGGDGLRKRILSQPTADGQECAQNWRDGTILEPPWIGPQRRGLCVSQDCEGKRIVVNARDVQELMGRAPERNTLCGSTRPTFSHPRFAAS
jgi:hypothetical protein